MKKYMTENGVVYEKVIKHKVSCKFYGLDSEKCTHDLVFLNDKHNCRLKAIKPDPHPYRYTCLCNEHWRFCDIP